MKNETPTNTDAERLAQLRREIQDGKDAIQRGDFKTYASADELMDGIERQIKERAAKKTT